MRLTQKQELFTQNLFKGMTQREAWIQAGYSSKYAPAIIDKHACELANLGKIKVRYAELNKKTEDDTVATVLERKQILTEITRGNLIDYQEAGADGGYLNIGKESPNTRAISEITSRTDEKDSVITKVKLHSPTSAIDLLNKMDKIYSNDVGGNTIVFNIEQAVIDAGNRLEVALKRLSERVLPEALESKSDSLLEDNDV